MVRTERQSMIMIMMITDTQKNILAETSASSATISRVNRCLTGGTGGYERAFAKVDAEEKK